MTAPIPAPTAADGGPAPWQAHHVYYTANTRPVVLRCVEPLIRSLRADNLIDGWFFINYWVEGPHLRLRIRPRTQDVAAEVRSRTERAIGDFLQRRPSLYHVSSALFVDSYNTLFKLEFRPEERERFVDSEGVMAQRPHNTFTAEPYEPEYGKYGGPDGVALAEWHFAASSDLVVEIDQTLNVHLRNVVLGIAAQVMMVTSSAFLRDDDAIADYLDSYHDFWQRSFSSTPLVADVDDAKTGAARDALSGRLSAIQQAISTGHAGALPPLLGRWLDHCLELRTRVEDLATAGRLRFGRWDGPGHDDVTEPDDAVVRLLSPYLHMTNNRLQATLSDEAYLAQLISRALRPQSAQQVPA